MKYRLMTENDLEYVVEKNNEYYNNVEGCCWTYEKAYKRIYQVLTMENSWSKLRNPKYVFRLEKAVKI